jgi:hypothetical protein
MCVAIAYLLDLELRQQITESTNKRAGESHQV